LLAAYLGSDAAERVSAGQVLRRRQQISSASFYRGPLGDGVLAVFLPSDGANVPVVTPAVLAAAREILARVEALNATETKAGNPTLNLNIGLHAGEVTCGNIGTADRLDFTVIGPAVNESARLEKLCKELGTPILISKSFVQAAQGVREQLLPLGRHSLRGVREAQGVFTVFT
jgi:adenylate cyclase